jgi:parallel beta-helix repeat protein
LLAPAFGAATVEVGTCSTFPQYSTIQAAVNSSPTGTLIYVCPGNYPEQVTINKNLTLQGLKLPGAPGLSASVISAPAGGIVANTASLRTPSSHIAAQVFVKSPATSVTINNITVDGQNSGINSCDPDLIGIYFQNASGTVTRSAIVNEVLGSGLEGCQSGEGIYIQSGSSKTSVVNVNNTIVANYEKNGITGNEVGTTLNASANTVVGRGSTSGAAENGIQLAFGAQGTITNNSIADDIWAPDTVSDPGDAAAGILVYASPDATVTSNRVTNTQFGIAVVTDSSIGNADSANVSSNVVSATRIFDAIDVCSNGNTVNSNTVNGADESGIHLDDTCGSTGSGNIVENNIVSLSCAGILQGTGTGNTLSGNVYYNVVQQKPTGDACPQISPSLAANFKQSTAAKSRPNFKPSRL